MNRTIEFIADPLRLLFRSSFRTAALACLMLALAGCKDWCKEKITRGNIHRFIVTTDGSGRVIQIENQWNGQTKSYDHAPIEEVFPPDYNPFDPNSIYIPPGELARPAVSPSSTLFGLAANGSILQFDVATTAVSRTLPTQFNWQTGAGSLRNDRIYAIASGTQSGSTYAPSLSIVNMTTFLVEQTIPLPANVLSRAVATSPDGKFLYIAGPANGPADTISLLIFDTTARTITKTITLDGSLSQPQVLASADGGLVFMTTNRGVAVIDALTQTFSHLLPESTGTHIVLDPTGLALYLAPVFSTGSVGVAVYDIATSTRTGFIPVANLGTMSMAVTPDGAYLAIDQIVPDAQGRNDFPVIKIIDLATGQLVVTLPWNGSRDTPYTTRKLVILPEP